VIVSGDCKHSDFQALLQDNHSFGNYGQTEKVKEISVNL